MKSLATNARPRPKARFMLGQREARSSWPAARISSTS